MTDAGGGLSVDSHAMTPMDVAVEKSGDNAGLFRLLRLYCAGSAIVVVGIGCLILLGWELRIELLKTVFPGFVTMKANTALGLLLSGTSLWILLPGEPGSAKARIARTLALLVALIGVASFSEYLSGLDLGIDQWLFNDDGDSYGTSSPGRMAPPSAIAFAATGTALMLMNRKTRRDRVPAQYLSLLVGLIALLGISGYIYHATALTRILLYTQIAVHTAIAFLLLSGAIFFARPRSGIAADLTGEGSGSVMARRLLPAVFGIPIVLGWIRLRGQMAGLYGTELGLAINSTGTILIFAVLVWLSARKMNVEYDLRSKAQDETRALNADLEERVAERTKTLEKAEAELLRTVAELNRSNEELAQFASVASHDLQEPLGMVASYTQLLSSRYTGKLDPEADEFLAFALDGANRMQRLIQDLLAYSRVGSKGKDLRDVSSEQALKQAIRQLRGAIEDSGAVVTQDPLPAVMADETQLIQLFQNLVGNAIKYQSPGTPRIHISADRNGGNEWKFSVRDNGLGIDPRNFERIFGMFQRLHRRDEFAGTGIGLAICKKIVERHGGAISVESAPGQGSVFQFALAGNEMAS